MLNSFFKIFKMQKTKYKCHYIMYTFVSLFHGAIFDFLPILYMTLVDSIMMNIFPKRNLMLYIAITLIAYLLIKIWSLSNEIISNKILKQMSSDISNKFLTMKESILESETKTYWRTILSTDIHIVAQLFTDFIYTLPSSFLSILITLGILFYYDIKIFALATLYIFLHYLIIAIRQKKLIPQQNELQVSQKNLQSHVMNFYEGAIDIYGANAKNFVIEKINRQINSIYKKIKHIAAVDFLLNTLSAILNFAFMFLTFLFLKNNFSAVTLGVIILLLENCQKLWDSCLQLIDDLSYIQDYSPYLDRVYATLKQDDEVPRSTKNMQHAIVYRNVSLGFADKKILANINFTLNDKDRVALIGKSGVGKTTLVKSFLSEKNIISGEASVSNEFLKSAIYLHQKPYIFNASIATNITLDFENKIKISEAKITTVLEKLELNFLKDEAGHFDLRRNMKTLTENISGGERNRIALARILLSDSKYYILDEPLIGVSGNMRKNIIEYLKNWSRDKTIILISHADDLCSICNNVINVENFV